MASASFSSAFDAAVAQATLWRRAFHAKPELAYAEHETSATVKSLLLSFGISEANIHHVARTGLFAALARRK